MKLQFSISVVVKDWIISAKSIGLFFYPFSAQLFGEWEKKTISFAHLSGKKSAEV